MNAVVNALDVEEGGSLLPGALGSRSTLHKPERGIQVKRCVERALVGLAIVAAVIGGVAAWGAWGGGQRYGIALAPSK